MSKPRIVYLVTEDWYFVSHRLPMARAARDAGYDVHVATHVERHADAITAEGFTVHPLNLRRGRANPFGVLMAVAAVRRVYRRVLPDLAHHVGLQPSLFGAMAAQGLPIVHLNALAGLGFVFTSASPIARIIRPVVSALFRALLNRPRAAVLVQNPDDRLQMERLGIAADRIALIPGSGVDTALLTPMPEPDGAMTAAFVGRFLDDKGLRTLIAAHNILSRRDTPVRLLLAGEPDPANPTSIPEHEIAGWVRDPSIVRLGHVSDIRSVWAQAHIAVLPSRREGLPKTLMEAAACGRPIVATDVPGCREIARRDFNALLVPPDNAAALADAIERLAHDPQLRERFAGAGRALVERELSDVQIGRQIVALYGRLVGQSH